MTMILELLAMPLARRILGAALVLAALAAIAFAIYHAGTHAGAAAEASRQVAAGKASFERIEADVRGRLDAASAREQQLAALVDKLTSDSAVASGRAAAAQSAAAADRARIAALSDSALRSDLAQRLGGVIPSGEPTALDAIDARKELGISLRAIRMEDPDNQLVQLLLDMWEADQLEPCSSDSTRDCRRWADCLRTAA